MSAFFQNLTANQTTLVVSIVGGAFIVVGAGINALLGWIFASWKNRVESKREYRRLAIETALENWRHQNTLKIDLMKSGGTGNVSIDPPETYIMHMLRVMNIAADMKISSSEAADRIALWSRGAITSDGKPTNKSTEQVVPSNGP